MHFKDLTNIQELEDVVSSNDQFIIFKHNTTCPISKGVKQRLENEGDILTAEAPCYMVNLLDHRDVSDAISQTFHVEHESPQLLVIKNRKCVFNQALYNISAEETAEALHGKGLENSH